MLTFLDRARWTAAAAAFAVASAVSLAAVGPADAQKYSQGAYGPRGNYVVAESRWGKGTVSGPVRSGPKGWQVRLPGGTWIDCVRSCSDTLRRQTVDFWEANGPRSLDDGPGYFRWSFGF